MVARAKKDNSKNLPRGAVYGKTIRERRETFHARMRRVGRGKSPRVADAVVDPAERAHVIGLRGKV